MHLILNHQSIKLVLMNKYKILILLASVVVAVVFVNCATPKVETAVTTPGCLSLHGTNTEWSGETEIVIIGYTGNAMEPRVSSDQITLFFNNKTSSDTEMNIHYALRTAPNTYLYKGTLTGTVSPSVLDGVPAVDSAGRFYFVSTRTYGTNYGTLFSGQAAVVAGPALEIQNVASADASVTLNTPGKLDMDIDVSWDGTLAVASNADFTGGLAYPDTSKLAIYTVNTTNRTFSPNSNSTAWLANVNLSQCRVYAGNLSNDLLELYFTVFPSGTSFTASDFKIAVSKRSSTAVPFGTGAIISAISGDLAEGPSISMDDGGKSLFYHRKDAVSGNFKIYKVTRP